MLDQPPALLLEQIVIQQAQVAVLERRLQDAERAVGQAATAAAGAAAHRRADDALSALEAAEHTLHELLAEHAAATAPLRSSPASRRLRVAPMAGQDGLFDVG